MGPGDSVHFPQFAATFLIFLAAQAQQAAEQAAVAVVVWAEATETVVTFLWVLYVSTLRASIAVVTSYLNI